MTTITSLKLRRKTALTIALSLAFGVAGTLLVERVRAAGPPSGAITYTGILENPDGTPVETPVAILLEMFDAETDGTKLCEISQPDVQPIAGRFQIDLPAACETAMKANANTWMQVSVGGVPVGRTQIGAVPYALEAGHSLSADSAPWAGISGIPTGFADGTDQNTTYTPGSGLDLNGSAFSVDPTDFNSVPQFVHQHPNFPLTATQFVEAQSTVVQAPVAGRIVAMASAGLYCPGGTVCDDVADAPWIAITLTVDGGTPDVQTSQYTHLSGGAPASRYKNGSVHRVFPVAAGSHTVRLMAYASDAGLVVDAREIVAFFVPD